jgi:hypothetical protein
MHGWIAVGRNRRCAEAVYTGLRRCTFGICGARHLHLGADIIYTGEVSTAAGAARKTCAAFKARGNIFITLFDTGGTTTRNKRQTTNDKQQD